MPPVDKSQGMEPYFKTDLTATTVLVKAGKVNLYHYDIYNGGGALAYIQLHDAAAAVDVTLGTTVPVAVIPVLSASRSALSNPLSLYHFDKGLVIAATTTTTGAVAPAATQVVNLGYSG